MGQDQLSDVFLDIGFGVEMGNTGVPRGAGHGSEHEMPHAGDLGRVRERSPLRISASTPPSNGVVTAKTPR